MQQYLYGLDFPLHEEQIKIIKAIKECVYNKQVGLFESPTGTGKTLSLLCGSLETINELKKLGLEKTLIYCTRTHSQICQVVEEFEKTEFKHTLSLVSLASRKLTCINNEIIEKANNSPTDDINTLCQKYTSNKHDILCSFYSKFQELIKNNVDIKKNFEFEKTLSTANLVKIGKEYGMCPYFLSQNLYKTANIIVLPYSLLIDKYFREKMQFTLHNSIIIFDEAHNIPNYIYSTYTICINQISKKLIKFIKVLESYKIKCKSVHVNSKLTTILHFFHKIHLVISKTHSDILVDSQSFVDTISCANIDFLTLFDDLSDYNFLKPFLCLPQLSNFLHELIRLVFCLSANDPSGRLFYNANSLKYFATSPSYFLHEIVESSTGVIFASGTLSPIDIYRKILFEDSYIPVNILEIERHVDKSNFICFSIFNYLGKDFDFSFKRRNDIESIVPEGLVVFISSNSLLQILVKNLSELKFLEEISKFKDIFIDDQKHVFERYVKNIKENKRGSILLSVLSGSLSEGVNFNDELARCIVITGVPFPDPNSMEFKERSKTMQLRGINSRDYIETEAIISVNQAIGRAIRHKLDYATVFLVDIRYNSKFIHSKLSSWIQNCHSLVGCEDESLLIQKLKMTKSSYKGVDFSRSYPTVVLKISTIKLNIAELTKLQSIHSQYLLKILDFFELDEYFCTVLEYMPFGDLSALMKRNEVDNEKKVFMLIQVLLGINDLHKYGIVHRDIKPRNIFVESPCSVLGWRIKIGDFGVSKFADGIETFAETLIGTPLYLSPEICLHDKYDAKTDIWSLGCMIYELFAGKQPFSGRNFKELITNIVKGSFDPLICDIEDINSFVELALTKNPKKRPSISELLHTSFVRKSINRLFHKHFEIIQNFLISNEDFKLLIQCCSKDERANLVLKIILFGSKISDLDSVSLNSSNPEFLFSKWRKMVEPRLINSCSINKTIANDIFKLLVNIHIPDSTSVICDQNLDINQSIINNIHKYLEFARENNINNLEIIQFLKDYTGQSYSHILKFFGISEND